MKIENSELINKIRTDSIMSQIYNYAERDGLTEVEMLSKMIVILLNLKDEAFQEKIDELMRKPAPLLTSITRYL